MLLYFYNSEKYHRTQKISSLAQKLILSGLNNFMGKLLILGWGFQPLCSSSIHYTVSDFIVQFFLFQNTDISESGSYEIYLNLKLTLVRYTHINFVKGRINLNCKRK